MTTSPLTEKQIRDIIGTADDELVVELIETDANATDLLTAFAWVNEDDAMGRDRAEPPTGVVGQLCDILLRAQEAGEDERR